jgi:hypothetical protein
MATRKKRPAPSDNTVTEGELSKAFPTVELRRAYDRVVELGNIESQLDDVKAQLKHSQRDAIKWQTDFISATRRVDELEVRLQENRRNREQTLVYSNSLLTALTEAVEYDPQRHHNRPPPPLRIDGDPKYLNELRSLIGELKKLNALLKKNQARKAEKSAADFGKYAHTFLEHYIPLMGRGTAMLTIGTVAGLLLHAGVPEAAISSVWSLVKMK